MQLIMLQNRRHVRNLSPADRLSSPHGICQSSDHAQKPGEDAVPLAPAGATQAATLWRSGLALRP